ncbi:protein FRIGIDA-ESSENTIAL 1 isoform X2 [Humulus lupulus]|uniref:protein FRIGIDA-ESSENTIAL 1 isoform X2 n=1 Tax=Humulus lupulus TaxID=3486 RepID=UPI002B411F1A|nr:protein FRIGIDA-ESSENTIAL 1 isoform X2 [Humulus lupulus]
MPQSPLAEVSDSSIDDDDQDEEVGDVDDEKEQVQEKSDDDMSVSTPEANDDHLQQDDVRDDLKSQRHDGSSGPSSSTREKFVEDVAFSKSCTSLDFAVSNKDGEILSEKSPLKHHRELNSDSNPDLRVSDITNAKSSSSSFAEGKEMGAALQMNDSVRQKDVLYSQYEIKQTVFQSCNDEKRKVSRLAASEIETRSHSPGAEIMDQNKRPAVICDFYAKGWCIKGSSCRFLHVKDRLNSGLPRSVGDGVAENKVEVQFEGLRETTQKSRSPSFHDALAPSVGNNSAFPLLPSSESIKPLERLESKGSHDISEMPKFVSFQREVFPLSFKDIGRESKNQIRPANDYSGHSSLTNRDGPVFNNSSRPEYAVSSSGNIISSANYRFINPPSHSRSTEEPTSIQSQHKHNNQTLTSQSPDLSSSNSLLNTGMLSSNRISSWTESSLPLSYSSVNPSPLGPRSSLFLQSSSRYSGSEPDNLPSTNHKSHSNDWEPSVPFQPSFLVRSMLSSTGSQYDPLRDVVELSKLGDISLRASYYSQGSSIVNTLHPQKHGEVVPEAPDLACNDDMKSVSSHNTYQGKMLGKNCQTQGKDMQATELKVAGTSTGRKKGSAPKQKNSLGSKDITEATSDGRHQSQRHGPYGSLHVKADRLGQKKEKVAGHSVEGVLERKESKAQQQFRAALIDFVKELLKPKWSEGNLSKDAHKKIVKKSVEKVLSTLQPEQIPPSVELVKQYLASFRPKLEKLVAGYAGIYGKL